MKRIPVLFVLSLPLVAGEFAVLENGFRLPADRHERDGADYVLYLQQGSIRIPASKVTGFEIEESLPPAPSAAPQPAAPPSPALPANPKPDPEEMIRRATARHGLSPEVRKLARSVAAVESGFQLDAVSPKGAIGLMQLMPATAASLQADPRDPEQNADAGVRYLRDLLIKYQGYDDQVVRALAAYNAGPAAVDRYNGVPPYRETRQYVRKVVRKYQQTGATAEPAP